MYRENKIFIPNNCSLAVILLDKYHVSDFPDQSISFSTSSAYQHESFKPSSKSFNFQPFHLLNHNTYNNTTPSREIKTISWFITSQHVFFQYSYMNIFYLAQEKAVLISHLLIYKSSNSITLAHILWLAPNNLQSTYVSFYHINEKLFCLSTIECRQLLFVLHHFYYLIK